MRILDTVESKSVDWNYAEKEIKDALLFCAEDFQGEVYSLGLKKLCRRGPHCRLQKEKDVIYEFDEHGQHGMGNDDSVRSGSTST